MKTRKTSGWVQASLCGVGLALLLSSTGCQITEGGQTLPSPYYLQDDVQYFPAGPEFKLQREAAALKAYQAEQQMQQEF
jgi:hypothetical protein